MSVHHTIDELPMHNSSILTMTMYVLHTYEVICRFIHEVYMCHIHYACTYHSSVGCQNVCQVQ